MATYDLIPTMTKYLDPQLAFALLEFIRARAIYKDADVLEAQIKLLKATNMVEFTMELHNELHGANTAPKEMEERRDAVIKRVTELQENSRRIFDVISDKNTVQNLKADRNLNITFLKENFGIGPEQVETLFDYAKCIYECGDYEAAGELLHQYCTYSVDPQKLLSAMWGKLASEILAFNVRPARLELQHIASAGQALDVSDVGPCVTAPALRPLQQPEATQRLGQSTGRDCQAASCVSDQLVSTGRQQAVPGGEARSAQYKQSGGCRAATLCHEYLAHLAIPLAPCIIEGLQRTAHDLRGPALGSSRHPHAHLVNSLQARREHLAHPQPGQCLAVAVRLACRNLPAILWSELKLRKDG